MPRGSRYLGFHPPFHRFWSHSLVKAEDGRLFDITPGPTTLPFIREPNEVLFAEFAEMGFLHLDHLV
jgi:hypothetical protein